MILQQLKLQNFRNYEKLDIVLSKNLNIFYGMNAQGKTNILEAIYLLALTKSHRTNNDIDMLCFAGCGVAVADASEGCRKAADVIVAGHDEDGVGDWIIDNIFNPF